VDGVGEESKTSEKAQIPKANGDDQLLFFLRSQPLNGKAKPEDDLKGEAEGDPEFFIHFES
jgi:hypothetical protein